MGRATKQQQFIPGYYEDYDERKGVADPDPVKQAPLDDLDLNWKPTLQDGDDSGWETMLDEKQKPQSAAHKHRSRKGRYAQERSRDEADWNGPGTRERLETALLEAFVVPEGSQCLNTACSKSASMACFTCQRDAHFCEVCMIERHMHTINHRLMVDRGDGLGLVPFTTATTPTMYARHAHEHSQETLSVTRVLLVSAESTCHYNFSYCGCSSLSEQLVEAGFWPSRPSKPHMAFSVSLMSLYRAINLNCKSSVRSFCQVLKEPSLLNPLLPSLDTLYSNFRRAFYEFRRASYKLDIIEDCIPSHSGLPLRCCPACPRPGESGPLHLAIDANFRLGRRQKAGKLNQNDVAEDRYFASRFEVEKYLKEHNADHAMGASRKKRLKRVPSKRYSAAVKVKPCKSVFTAGDMSRKSSKMVIFDEKGVLCIVCARHGIPLAMVDIYHGERYEYADFLLMKYLKNYEKGTGILYQLTKDKIYIYYDINCKYFPHFMEVLEQEMPSIFDRIVPVIPEMHVKAHDINCQLMLHPKRVPGTGLTDGEGTERLWSWLQKLHTLVKEQTAENRREQLCDSLQHLSRKKMLAMGYELNRKYNTASEGLQTALMILKHEMGEKHTIEEIRDLYLKEKLGELRPVGAEKKTAATLRLPETLQEQYCQIRSLERSRYQVRRWRDSHKLPGGTKNTLGFSNSISVLTKNIKDAVFKANETMITLEEAGIDCGEPLTVAITGNFKSWFWLGYKVEQGGIRVAIDAYCLVVHHVEERSILQSEIKRSLSHIEDDIQQISKALNECPTLMSNGLICHLHKEIHELKRCYSKYVLHDPISNEFQNTSSSNVVLINTPTPLRQAPIPSTLNQNTTESIEAQALVPQMLDHMEEKYSKLHAVPQIDEPLVISDVDDDDEDLQVLESRDIEDGTINVIYDEIDMKRWVYMLTTPDEWLSNFLLHKAFLCLHENSPYSHLFEIPGLSLQYQSGNMKDAIQFDHVNNNHWVTLHLHRETQSVYMYNSKHYGVITPLSATMTRKLSRFFGGNGYDIVYVWDLPQQNDEYNCGVYAIAYAQCLYAKENPRDWFFPVETMRQVVLDGIVTGILPQFERNRR